MECAPNAPFRPSHEHEELTQKCMPRRRSGCSTATTVVSFQKINIRFVIRH